MKVYLVKWKYVYDGHGVIGVYLSEKAAIKAGEKWMRNMSADYYSYTIEEAEAND